MSVLDVCVWEVKGILGHSEPSVLKCMCVLEAYPLMLVFVSHLNFSEPRLLSARTKRPPGAPPSRAVCVAENLARHFKKTNLNKDWSCNGEGYNQCETVCLLTWRSRPQLK